MQPKGCKKKGCKQAAIAATVSFCAAVILSGCNRSGNEVIQSPPPQKAVSRPTIKTAQPIPTPAAKIDKQVSQLKLSQAIGQRIIYAYAGFSPPKLLRQMIARDEVGGIIIFKRNVKSYSHLTATLRDLQAIPRLTSSDAPLLIMIDQEGGQVKRLPGPPERSPRQIGRVGSTAMAKREGVATGRYLKACGVNVNLAPVVDVARPRTYQERTSRAYGRDSTLVANMAGAFADGMLEAGVVPCFKHFPGLGAAFTNEDLKINRLDIALPTLDKVDGHPFTKATANSMVMTSTAIYPDLDKQPALFSRRIVTQQLEHLSDGLSGANL